jgi:hypothetical protein
MSLLLGNSMGFYGCQWDFMGNFHKVMHSLILRPQKRKNPCNSGKRKRQKGALNERT